MMKRFNTSPRGVFYVDYGQLEVFLAEEMKLL